MDWIKTRSVQDCVEASYKPQGTVGLPTTLFKDSRDLLVKRLTELFTKVWQLKFVNIPELFGSCSYL